MYTFCYTSLRFDSNDYTPNEEVTAVSFQKQITCIRSGFGCSIAIDWIEVVNGRIPVESVRFARLYRPRPLVLKSLLFEIRCLLTNDFTRSIHERTDGITSVVRHSIRNEILYCTWRKTSPRDRQKGLHINFDIINLIPE